MARKMAHNRRRNAIAQEMIGGGISRWQDVFVRKAHQAGGLAA